MLPRRLEDSPAGVERIDSSLATDSPSFRACQRYDGGMASLEAAIKEQALALGFELAGIAAATRADSFERLREWLYQGHAGEMAYMHRQEEARRHPDSILPGVRSVVMVGMNYKPEESETADARSTGRIARYARGADYHPILWERLGRLLEWLRRQRPDCRGRAVVDTAPLLERDFARRAGLGWFGKNTMLLNKRLGSYFFLGALLTDLELQPDPPHETAHCGTCTACLEACPTQAFVSPGVLDSRRCISYLTIELRGPVPEELRSRVGDWLFGCDVCQEVCPWNRKAPGSREPAFLPHPDLEAADPAELLSLSEEAFRRRFRGTALMRAKRRGILRNAALVLGNRGDPAALPALRQALHDPEPVVREAAQWAIEQIQKSA
jgi:epoxyqueuosine reductase